MNKETKAIVIGMLGGLLLSITLSGKFTSYVKPGFKPMLLIAGGLLLALAIISLVQAIRDDLRKPTDAVLVDAAAVDGAVDFRETGHVDHVGDGDGHEGHSHSTRAPWLMLLPVLVLLFVAPPALGSDAVSRGVTCGTPAPAGTTYASRRTKTEDPLPAGNPVPLSMSEFVSRSLYDSKYSTVDTDIQVTAFVTHSSCDGTGYSLVRLKISCCAADAIALRTHIDAPPQLPENTWVQATLRAVKNTGDQANNYVPTATVISMQTIPQPDDPYET